MIYPQWTYFVNCNNFLTNSCNILNKKLLSKHIFSRKNTLIAKHDIVKRSYLKKKIFVNCLEDTFLFFGYSVLSYFFNV